MHIISRFLNFSLLLKQRTNFLLNVVFVILYFEVIVVKIQFELLYELSFKTF